MFMIILDMFLLQSFCLEYEPKIAKLEGDYQTAKVRTGAVVYEVINLLYHRILSPSWSSILGKIQN